MFKHLQIYKKSERRLVGCLDSFLTPLGAINGWRRVRPTSVPKRVLLLRLERIGDLLMVVDAVHRIRAHLPSAFIQLVVGSWNDDLAKLISGVDQIQVLNVPWLAREDKSSSVQATIQMAWGWREQEFDLAINFESDIRSNALLAVSGAPRRVGYRTGGGEGFLTDALNYKPTVHTADNARRLVQHIFSGERDNALATDHLLGPLPDHVHQRADELLGPRESHAFLIGINVGGGRQIKQWPAERFADTASILSHEDKATIVLLGNEGDQSIGNAVVNNLSPSVHPINLIGHTSLIELAGVLERLRLLVTGDTGPMHLAASIGTPVVSIFGPSDPVRYAPLTSQRQIVHAELWCRPCNQIRCPPARCSAGTPDCLEKVSVPKVIKAIRDLLRS